MCKSRCRETPALFLLKYVLNEFLIKIRLLLGRTGFLHYLCHREPKYYSRPCIM